MKKISLFLVFLTGTLLACPASAAVFSFSTDANDLYVGDQFEVKAFIDTKDENINAVEGIISYPTGQLQLLDIKIGDSLINFWLEKPTISYPHLAFSGITPGGFVEKNGYLFSLIFQAKNGGTGSVAYTDPRALKNDGRGTEAKSSARALPIKIISLARKNGPRLYSPLPDALPPEIFQSTISRSPEVFNNKLFVYFDTQDKNSGIDHFEVKEKKYYNIFGFTYETGRWQFAESPYLLHDQGLNSEIQIKAVDRAGNERITTISPTNRASWYQNVLFWCIILLIVIPIITWKIIPKV